MEEETDFYAGGAAGELSLPRASVLRAIKDMMPKGMRCSTETGMLVLNCCNEFVRMLSDEANVLCEQGGKSTIAPDHITESLKGLGFGAWEAQVSKAHEEYKKAEKARPKMGKNPMASSGLTHEELVALQQKLLAGDAPPPAAPPAPAQQKGKGKEGGGGKAAAKKGGGKRKGDDGDKDGGGGGKRARGS